MSNLKECKEKNIQGKEFTLILNLIQMTFKNMKKILFISAKNIELSKIASIIKNTVYSSR